MKDLFEGLREQLNSHYSWPAPYTFKFVVPSGSRSKLLEVVPQHSEITEKKSKTGKYTSVTIRKVMGSAEEIISAYKRIKTVEGVISL